ncbi:MAG: tRNA pseudouridine(38-40) synthase TruA [Anaerolineales bacterium]|nr:tRNA pseudouridine(38-40) synthase TruA [Anaerolineales bacterium]
MARYQATIAYDGTAFWGFQAQPGFRTVEGELRSALGTLGRRDEPLLAGGRTDAGVHAAGQVIAFDLAWSHPAEELQRALNALLPDDIACPALGSAAEDFHPRYHALKRCYRYRVIAAPWPDPLRERYALRVWPAPDVDAMTAAARDLPGKKDFGAFGSAPREGSHTVRTVLRADWLRNGEELEFWIEADAFLFRMVRTIAGTLLQLGGGRRTRESILGLLETPAARGQVPPRGRAAPPAPAHGLCLMRIEYPGGGQG